MNSEPILSLSLGTVALGLFLVVGGAIGLSLLLARRRRGATHPTPGTADVLWLATLLEGLPQAALIVDTEGHPVVWNAAGARSLSLPDGAPGLLTPVATLISQVLNTGTAETVEIAAPGDADHRLRVTALPLGKKGKGGALVLAENPAETGGRAESYRRLISAVTHELRTPLTAIMGHADILGSCTPEEEVLWRRSRDFIASEAERLARLVEDLLTLSRLDLTPLQRRPVNLRAVAEEAISTLFQAATARGIQLALQSPPNLPRVLSDRDRLQQVFLNLLDNAIKYSCPGGKAVVRFKPEAGFVQAEVHNDGAGIAPEDQPYIFDPLYRSEGVRDVPGTGLGLTIVRTVLEQHGATIGVQSAPNEGTTFHFCLPEAQRDPPLPP